MPFLRDLQPELMDDPALSRTEHEHALVGLSRLNFFSGVIGGMYRQVTRFAVADRPLKVLDIASGSGDLPVAWAQRARKNGLNLDITATDISAVAVDEQQQRAKSAGVEIRSLQSDCFAEELPGGFDVVTCSLFMHHLTEQQSIDLLRAMRKASDNAVVVCDLDRTRLNYAIVGFASQALTRSHVVHTDALLSVKNAYTKAEFAALAQTALGHSVSVKTMFPSRFLMIDQLDASGNAT